MLMPIVTIRNAIGPGDDAAQSVRRALQHPGQRAETIQKILDALGRHLSGEAVLSRDALVRLIEDLSQLLRSSALPQENGRAVARRLVEMLESLPAPERLAIEKELGGRSPAQRIAVAARSVGSTAATPMAASPLPADRTAIRNLPLQTSVPAQTFAAQAPAASDLTLLQAILRKTFGVDEESAQAEQTIEDEPETEPGAKTSADASKASNAGEGRSRSPADTRSPATVAPALSEDGAAEADAAQRILPETPENTPRAAGEKAGASLLAAAGGETSGSKASTEAAPKKADRASGETEAAAENSADAAADGLDSDGTYGPSRAKGENDRQQARPAATRGEAAAAPSRSLADAIKVLASDGLTAREKAAGSVRPEAPEPVENAQQPTPSELTSPEHGRDAGLRPRNATAGAQPSAGPAAAETPDAPTPSSPAMQQRPRQAGEDPAMQQAIAFLVESGLPKEIIPFALVPYPPSEAEAEGGSDNAEQHSQEDSEDEAGEGPDDGEGEGEKEHAGGEGDAAEDPDAADAYDLYRKLGGLG
jgi:hypothetical protein